MKKLWLNAIPYEKELVLTALESGAEAVVLKDENAETVKQFGQIKTVAGNGDIVPERDVFFIDVANKEDEQKAANIAGDKIVVVKLSDWTIIPIENILAQRTGPLLVEVENAEQAKLMIEILEKGADGVVLTTKDFNEIKKTANVLQGISMKIELVEAEVTSIKQLGMGDRACLDTCSQMKPGEGMLVGNSAKGFFLVHSESLDNPYVASRPFRVNAGAVHAYTMTPGGKTKYLSDLSAGDEVMIVDADGNTQTAYLGRNKIEKRPLMLLEAKVGEKKVSLVLQNAETIRLMSPAGEAVSITSLKPGQKILAHIEESGRHFGMKVEETLTER